MQTIRNLPARGWAFLGEYPLTIGGCILGLALAVFLWSGQNQIRNHVERIERRVIVVERHDSQSSRSASRAVCVVGKPDSPGCRVARKGIRDAIRSLSPEGKRKLLRDLGGKAGRDHRVNGPVPSPDPEPERSPAPGVSKPVAGAPGASPATPAPSASPAPTRTPLPVPTKTPAVGVHVRPPRPLPDVDVEVHPAPVPTVIPDVVDTVTDVVGNALGALPPPPTH